jgi:predicted lipid-binding transport protein (Tim44 family)
MIKKITSAIIAVMLVFTVMGIGTAENVSAKSYRSIPRSFTPHYQQKSNYNQHSTMNNPTNSKSLYGNKNIQRNNGGFLKGLFLGGLGGMLFSHLFGGAGYGLGFLSTIFSLFINLLVIAVIIAIISRIFRFRRRY